MTGHEKHRRFHPLSTAEASGRFGHARVRCRTTDAGDGSLCDWLTSLASVDLMLAIERDFGFLFPDDLLNRRTFASIGAIAAVIRRLGREPEAVV